MLSIRAFSSSGAASKYYSHGDYYGQEGQGTWLGEGARELGFTGEFTASSDKQFNNLLNGIMPSGQVLGRPTQEGVEHRPGIDLTFSCPKSFSVQMMLYSSKEEKQEMQEALMNAVGRTLSYIEKQGYAIARKGAGGKEKEAISKLSFATFMHTTNRNLEPQAHVHCFLANAAKCEDDKYRSLEFANILKNNKFLGQVFRNELALEAKKLGFGLNTTILSDGSSSFELSHIDQKVIDAFSTRRQEIEELCKLYGVTTKEGRDKIVINSRKAKQKVKEEDLVKTWQDIETNVQNDIKNEELALKVYESSPKTPKISSIFGKISEFFTKNRNAESDIGDRNEPLSARDLSLLCIEDVNANQSVFSQEELLKKTLKFGIGHYGVNDLQAELVSIEAEGILIRHGNYLTTKDILTKEKQIRQYAKASIEKSKPIIDQKYFDKHFEKYEKRKIAKDPDFKINDQQKQILKYILSSKDKIVTMEGLPGVGKSTVLGAVKAMSDRKIISLIGLGENYKGAAPTASAAKSLESSAKVESSTIHSFLAKYRGYLEGRGEDSLYSMRQEYKKTVIFIDECSLVSTKLMHSLLKLQDKFGFRLVLTGDTKQLGAVEAGKPFEQMLQILPAMKLTEIIRQKDASHKAAVIAASESKVAESFKIHKDNIFEAKNDISMSEKATALYTGKSQQERKETLLISPTRDLRDSINVSVIEALKKEGSLKGEESKFTALVTKDMTSADHKFAPSFGVGEIMRFHKGYKNGIDKGDYLRIKKINQITNSLILEKGKKDILFSLKTNVENEGKFEVFTEKELKLQEGLKIIFTKNNKEQGLINSETAVIQAIGKNTATLKIDNGPTKTVPLSELKHIDYGYCVTVHNSQGKTYDNTIAAIGNNKYLNNQQSWLVAISRHRRELTAIVEDKGKLEAQITKNHGRETSALDLVAQKEGSNPQNGSKPLHPVPQNAIISEGKDLEVSI